MQDQIRSLEIQLTEASAKESATREHLASVQEDKQRQEADFDTKLGQLRREHQLREDELQSRIS